MKSFHSPQAVKELQTSAREAIILLKAMIGEVRANVDEEESAICTLFNNMQVPCTSTILCYTEYGYTYLILISEKK